MFKKKPEEKKSSDKPIANDSVAPKFPHPKILLIDTESKIGETLVKEGYNVSSGTFGTPYKVQMDSGYQPVIMNPSLPNFTEQEIVVIDLVPDAPNSEPSGKKMTPEKELDWWAKCSTGIIDPRPRAMIMVRSQFDRILDNGGVFIVFSDSVEKQELVYAKRTAGYSDISVAHELPFTNWSFLSILSNLTINQDFGQEIDVIQHQLPLVGLLADHLTEAAFCCTFEPQWHIDKRWFALAKNKYGSPVAGLIAPTEKTKGGWILILPRIKAQDRFISAFLKNILPDLCPGLFPHAEGQKWVHRTEYELVSVLEKAKLISNIQDAAATKVSELEKAIETDRNANQYLYALIRETGEALVTAIIEALGVLGFESIVDVDEEMRKSGREASLREDIRIHDKSPTLVVDIKGVAGRPTDPDSLQAQKHAFIYIQEQNRADVKGLTIINHQRLLPPLDRDNEMPYRKEILDNAEQVKLGLMTGWDLFRLVRGFIQNKWKPEHVIPLFYKTGRILPIPQHYEYLGKVKDVWKAAFSVEIDQSEIRVGERIAFEFPVDFIEQQVKSLQLDGVKVEVASAKCEVGIQREESQQKIKSGMTVYRIIP